MSDRIEEEWAVDSLKMEQETMKSYTEISLILEDDLNKVNNKTKMKTNCCVNMLWKCMELKLMASFSALYDLQQSYIFGLNDIFQCQIYNMYTGRNIKKAIKKNGI